jgi:hypothetical protein
MCIKFTDTAATAVKALMEQCAPRLPLCHPPCCPALPIAAAQLCPAFQPAYPALQACLPCAPALALPCTPAQLFLALPTTHRNERTCAGLGLKIVSKDISPYHGTIRAVDATSFGSNTFITNAATVNLFATEPFIGDRVLVRNARSMPQLKSLVCASHLPLHPQPTVTRPP